jgi:hypothetical protein
MVLVTLVTGAVVNQLTSLGGPILLEYCFGIFGILGLGDSSLAVPDQCMEISGAKRLRISHTFPRS